MIELREEPYEGPAGAVLIQELSADLNGRYPRSGGDFTPEQIAAEEAAWFAQVTPDWVTRPRGAFVVARLDGELAGCGALKPLHVEGEPAVRAGHAEVKRMYTRPSARRRGVSRAVMVRLEAIAAELGYRTAWLETGTAQPEALALYESSGWHRIEPYGHFKDQPTSRCFAKDLTA